MSRTRARGVTSIGASNQISNTAAETLLAPTFQISSAYAYGNISTKPFIGNAFRVRAIGYLATKGSSPGTLTFKMKYGSTVLATSDAIALPTGLTNGVFVIDAVVAFPSISDTASASKATCDGFVQVAQVSGPVQLLNTGTAGANQVTVDTTAPALLGISGQFSLADAANVLTLTSFNVEELA